MMDIKVEKVNFRDMTEFYWYEDFFSSDEIEKIKETAKQFEFEDGKAGSVKAGSEVNHEVRSSRVKWMLLNDDSTWIYDKIALGIREANKECWDFDWDGKAETIQYTEYRASENGHYDWHQDCGDGYQSLRKMSAVVILNDDYEGGKLEIWNTDVDKLDQKSGSMVVFPSYMLHRVLPVTSGLRKSLVLWVGGTPYK
jgi:PKHD-type hydroxylase